MTIEKLAIDLSSSCRFTQEKYSDTYQPVCLEYVEHSPDGYYSDRDTSIDIEEEDARRIITFLTVAFPNLKGTK